MTINNLCPEWIKLISALLQILMEDTKGKVLSLGVKSFDWGRAGIERDFT